MSSLKDDFNEVLRRIRHGREFTHSSFEPIYYLVFSPEKIIEVKRNTPAWLAKLQNDGWEVTVFSIAEHVLEILKSAPMRKIWLAADAKYPQDWDKTNQSLTNALTKKASLQSRLEETLASLEGNPKAIVLVTDLEACILTCGLARSRHSFKVNSMFRRCFSIPESVRAKPN